MAVKATHKIQFKKTFTKKSDSSLICDYCHMSGHLRDKCYCIHGYPAWHRLFGKPKPNPKYLTSSTNTVVAAVSQMPTDGLAGTDSVSAGLHMSDHGSLNLSDSQCHKLIQLLQKNLSATQAVPVMPQASYTGHGHNWSSSYSVTNIVQFSGTITHSVSQIHNVSTDHSQFKWIIDTGATNHITPHLHLLQDVHSCTATLQFPNGATAAISHVGKLCLTDNIILSNVLRVPSFAYNFLSISKLLQDTTWQVTFVANKWYIQDHVWMKTLDLGKEENGLYVLNTRSSS